MVAKIDFDTLKMYQQMRLKIANQKKLPSTQNLFVLIKKRVYYRKERAPGESVLYSHARVVDVGLLSLERR